MPLRPYTDSNGVTYSAVNTAEWYGAYGDQLRAQGYRYCGFGTGGVYVAAPGQPCTTTPAPNIQPKVIAEDNTPTTPGPVGTVTDRACGTCKKTAASGGGTPPVAGGGVVTAPGVVRGAASSQYPWWVFVLAALTLAQVVRRG